MKKNVEKQKPIPPKKFDVDSVFPNHCHLASLNYHVEMGSFDVPMRQLLEWGLSVMKNLKDIEEDRL